ncbi:hypothetical protein B0H16DRAFT_1481029 [Mycena metata]|uniref:Alfy-like armadillo-like repeat domain-containing protein n=1 Tax=Mycena metata TaxID=1033252 RepID=A0AAD7H092_9AGAR|nr:hypothetical protein B0H16DRAFT_1481029 [Mycena metata]
MFLQRGGLGSLHQRLHQRLLRKSKLGLVGNRKRIMMQDAPGATKDVFREMDGFVGLMGALSTAHERGTGTGEEESVSETIECSRLAFLITSDAITDHPENAAYFKKRVGYDSLATAIHTLIAVISQQLGHARNLRFLLIQCH